MKYIILLTLIVITSCSTNGNKSYDIIEDARKFLVELAGKNESEEKRDENKTISDKKEVKIAKKKKSVAQEKIKLDQKKKIEKTQPKEKEIIESRLIKRKPIKNKKKVTKKNFKATDSSYIQIGVLLPLSGKESIIGNEILNALELALFQSGEKKIELVIRDTKADPKYTKIAYEDLLSSELKTIIGPLYSKCLLAIEEEATNDGVNIFALNNNINLAKSGIWVFGIDPEQQTKKIINFSFSKGNRKLAVLLPSNPYGYLLKSVVENTLSELGLEIERLEFFNNNIKDQESAAKKISKGFLLYEEYLKKIDVDNEKFIEDQMQFELDKEVKKPFDSVFIAASGQDLTIIASQLQYNGVDPKKVTFLGTSAWENKDILKEPALEGGFFSTTSDSYQKKIKSSFENIYDKEMSNISMIAYDILSLISASLDVNNKFSKDFVTKPQGFIGLRGLFRLENSGKVKRVFQVKKIKNKEFITYEKEPKRFIN